MRFICLLFVCCNIYYLKGRHCLQQTLNTASIVRQIIHKKNSLKAFFMFSHQSIVHDLNTCKYSQFSNSAYNTTKNLLARRASSWYNLSAFVVALFQFYLMITGEQRHANCTPPYNNIEIISLHIYTIFMTFFRLCCFSTVYF